MRQVLLYTDEDANWIADVPSLPGCHSDGKTREEAIERVIEGIDAYIASLVADDMPIPVETGNYELLELETDEASSQSTSPIPLWQRDRHSTASFRIMGDAVEPAAITEKLGLTPDHSHRKGDIRKKSQNGVHRSGMWLISSKLPEGESLENHLRDLLRQLEPHHTYLHSLSDHAQFDFFCGVFDMEFSGFELSPMTLQQIADLEAILGVAIY